MCDETREADRKCAARQGRLIENQFGEWIRAEIGRLGGLSKSNSEQHKKIPKKV